MNPKIFKAYDIRGIYPGEINEETVYNIGLAVAMFLKAKKIVVGRDIRESSPALFKSLAEGVTDQGADVYDLGLASTPMVYFASGRLGVDGGIVESFPIMKPIRLKRKRLANFAGRLWRKKRISE